MNLEEFVAHFAAEFDETPADVLTPVNVCQYLQACGSLTALSVISMIDEEMEKRITGADIRNCSTIRELFELAESK